MGRRGEAGGSWLDLATPYFNPVCRQIFDDYLQGHGFALSESEATSVNYRRGKCRIGFHHYVEDSPRFSPMVSIGLAPSSWAVFALCRLGPFLPRSWLPSIPGDIGLWYAIPEGERARDYGLWYFSSASELAQALERIRAEVVEVYARPLWEDPDRLLALMRKRQEEFRNEQERARNPGLHRPLAPLRRREEDLRRSAKQTRNSEPPDPEFPG